MNKLHEAVLSGDFAIVKKVFSSSFLSGRNEIGQTPFHTACSEGNIEIVTFLLKRKPNLDSKIIMDGLLYIVQLIVEVLNILNYVLL